MICLPSRSFHWIHTRAVCGCIVHCRERVVWSCITLWNLSVNIYESMWLVESPSPTKAPRWRRKMFPPNSNCQWTSMEGSDDLVFVLPWAHWVVLVGRALASEIGKSRPTLLQQPQFHLDCIALMMRDVLSCRMFESRPAIVPSYLRRLGQSDCHPTNKAAG